MINIQIVTSNKGSIARTILEDLPEWFGNPEANENYIYEASHLDMYVTLDSDNAVTGFISIKYHMETTAEVFLLGVARKHHGVGIGRNLVEFTVQELQMRGIEYLTVKTLAPTHPDINYGSTRKFYEAVNFTPLEIFPTLWGEKTPCLLMVRHLCCQPEQCC